MKTNELIQYIREGKLDARLSDIYLDASKLDYQRTRYIDAIGKFTEIFGGDSDVEIYSAPGRTEVGGNHTDHQHGQVLAASINDDAIAIVSTNTSSTVKVKSEGYDMITISLEDIAKKADEEGTTLALIKGVLASFRDRGYKIGGFNAYITSDVLGDIDFRDPKNPVIDPIVANLDTVGYSLCITDTKGSHADLTPDYAAVPAEMKAVAAYFGKEVLIEVSEEEVVAHIPELREKLGDRSVLRAIHFYEENKRVENEVAALKSGDFSSFLSNVKASGDSSYKFLQNVYTSHDVQHQNVSIALCISEKVLGADGGVSRVHGGGFAGTIQAFVKNEKVAEYKDALDKVFGEGACSVLKIRKYGGIRVI